jgi:hypothetical protein
LIENQASLISYEEIRSIRIHSEAQAFQRRQADLEWRQIVVKNWLSVSSHVNEQDKGAAIRAEFPMSGDWLLQQDQFKAWFDRDFCSAPLLWLNGKPGAGKMMLFSTSFHNKVNLSRENCPCFTRRGEGKVIIRSCPSLLLLQAW